MSFPMTPLYDRIIIERSEKETTSPGGIILAPSDEPGPAKGVIVAVGPGRRNKKGDLERPPVELLETVPLFDAGPQGP